MKAHDAEVAKKAAAEARKQALTELSIWREENRGKKVGYCTNGIIEDQFIADLMGIDFWEPKEWKEKIEVEARKDEREKVLEEKSKLIRDVISKDQSGLAESLAKIRTLAKGYVWIPAGEWGSYDYTQHTVETLQKECGYLLAEIEKISYEGLRDSGNRVTAHVRDCEEAIHNPSTPAVKEQKP